jgi:hypothetical protein
MIRKLALYQRCGMQREKAGAAHNLLSGISSDSFISVGELNMARGSKEKYTDKQKRQAEHIEEGYKERGVGEDEAERRAWATVNKSSGGGKKSGSGRGKKTNKGPAKKGGKKGGRNGGKKKGGRKKGGRKKKS